MDELEQTTWKLYPDKIAEFQSYMKRAFAFSEAVAHTAAERRKIEEEQAQRLTDLSIKYEKITALIVPSYAMEKHGKSRKVATTPYSYATVFKELINSIRLASDSHRQLAIEIERHCVAYKAANVDQQTQCTELFREVKKSEMSLDIAVQLLKEEKLKCRNLCAKAAKANEAADTGAAANRAKLQHQQTAVYQVQAANNAKRFYETSVQRANEQQAMHFQQELPRLLSLAESLEVKRVVALRDQLQAIVAAEKDMVDRVRKIFDDFSEVTKSVNSQSDALLVPGTLRSDANYKPFVEFVYEDFSISNESGTGTVKRTATSTDLAAAYPHCSSNSSSTLATVLQAHEAESPNELNVQVGESVLVLGDDENGWRLVARPNDSNVQGYVPSCILQMQ